MSSTDENPIMKQAALLLALLFTSSDTFAFTPKSAVISRLSTQNHHNNKVVSLRSTDVEAPSDVESEEQQQANKQQLSVNPTSLRNELLYTTKSLTEESPTGIFLTTPTAMESFSKATARLEAITPSMTQREKELLIGDWVLLATCRSLKRTSNVQLPEGMKKLPFNIKTPKLADSIRNSITVLQRIRRNDDEESDNEINRIDHVIQYTPLTLSDLIPEKSPFSAIRNWNVNPLEVSQSKITLIHDASVESIEPTLRTKINLKSVVVNVAGKSQYLEPNGADVLGLNIPSLGDFANSGSFDSTYVDENVRISRGTIGFLEEVRLFVRKGFDLEDIMEAGYVNEMETAEETEKTEVEARLEKISDAFANVVGAVEDLDKDVRDVVEKDIESVGKAVGGVRNTITDGVKEVQTVVEDDLKKVGKAVNDVASAVIGEQGDDDGEEEEVSEDVVVDVDAVNATAEDEESNDDDVPSDVNEM